MDHPRHPREHELSPEQREKVRQLSQWMQEDPLVERLVLNIFRRARSPEYALEQDLKASWAVFHTLGFPDAGRDVEAVAREMERLRELYQNAEVDPIAHAAGLDSELHADTIAQVQAARDWLNRHFGPDVTFLDLGLVRRLNAAELRELLLLQQLEQTAEPNAELPRAYRSETAFERALDRVAKGLSSRWRLQPREKSAAQARASEESKPVKDVKRYAAKIGLLEALSDADHPQHVRLGKKWVVEDGKVANVRPGRDFGELGFWWWLHATAIRAAQAYLLDEAPSAASTVPGDLLIATSDALDLPSLQRSPMDALIAEEQVETIFRLASPRQQEILKLLDKGYSQADAAEVLGIAPGTVGAQMHRLRDRLPKHVKE
jgi:hypothetical protein